MKIAWTAGTLLTLCMWVFAAQASFCSNCVQNPRAPVPYRPVTVPSFPVQPIQVFGPTTQATLKSLAFCPDYWVSHEEILGDGNRVAAFGGTIAVRGALLPENTWRISAAWLSVVENGLVKEWRVYADNKPVYDILAKAGRRRWSRLVDFIR